MTVLSPLPFQKFFDNDGAPLAGGLVFTYAAGTINKVVTWKDSAGSEENTNPIELDFRGECDIWITQGTAYKYVLSPPDDTDPPTNPIKTIDNVLFPAAGSGIVETIVAGSNVTVDATDPANPIVSATGGGGSAQTLVVQASNNTSFSMDGGAFSDFAQIVSFASTDAHYVDAAGSDPFKIVFDNAGTYKISLSVTFSPSSSWPSSGLVRLEANFSSADGPAYGIAVADPDSAVPFYAQNIYGDELIAVTEDQEYPVSVLATSVGSSSTQCNASFVITVSRLGDTP